MPEKEIIEVIGTCINVHYFDKKDPTNIWCALRFEVEDLGLVTGYVNCVGFIPRGEIVTGLHYRMMGYFEGSQSYGRQFWPQQWIQSRPQSRHAIICYLKHYCSGVGDRVANRFCDEFGEGNVLNFLKRQPSSVSHLIPGITLERANSISQTLILIEATQETMMELRGMLTGRGFSEETYSKIIDIWGADGPDAIKKNPFALMAKHVPGAGWKRCNTMWEEWGLPPDSLTRQMFGVYFIMDSHVDDHTWFSRAEVATALGQLISTNVKPEAAVNEGIDEGWIVEIEQDGEKWISTSDKAEDEAIILEHLME